MTLNEMKVSQKAIIKMVNGKGALRHRLLEMGLVPNTIIKLQKMAPLGDPLEIMIRGYELTLRISEAMLIEVEVINNENCINR